MYALGPLGLIVFTARFPDGRSNRATRYWDALAAAAFLYYFYTAMRDYVPLFTARPIGDLPGDVVTTIIESGAYLAILVVLCVKLRKGKRSNAAGLGWIVAGYGVGIVIGRIGYSDLSYFIDSAQRGRYIVSASAPSCWRCRHLSRTRLSVTGHSGWDISPTEPSYIRRLQSSLHSHL